MSVPSSSLDIEILPEEEFSYVLVDPGVFRDIEGFSYGKILVLELEEEGIENVKVSLRSGIFDAFDEELFGEVPRHYVLSNAVSQAEALWVTLVGWFTCV
jgi:hypothetical protein